MPSDFEGLNRLRDTSTKEVARHEKGLTREEEEERLIASIAALHEKTLKELQRFTEGRESIPRAEALDLALRVSVLWKDVAYSLSGVPSERIEEILQGMGIGRP